MPTDVAKLQIVVGTQGTSKSAKELDKVTKSSKQLSDQTKKTTKEKSKFASGIGAIKSSLAPLAAAYYLGAQAVNALRSSYIEVQEAYLDQLTSQVKLQTILSSTGEAIGFNIEQLNSMARTLEEQTGIYRTTITNAQAIGATFTRISSEAFPRMIEQAANMSTIFKQDLNQSIVQLGTALNDPIKGVGRLRRIGISFTQTQKEMIKGFIQQGDIISAQNVILEELEVEIGQVAKAMGEGLTGSLKRAENSTNRLNAVLGKFLSETMTPLRDSMTDFKNTVIEAFDESGDTVDSLTEKMRTYKKVLAEAGPEIAANLPTLPTTLTIEEINQGIIEQQKIIDETTKKVHSLRKDVFADNRTEIIQIEMLIASQIKLRKVFEDTLQTRLKASKEGQMIDPEGLKTAETWLENLRQQTKNRQELLKAERESDRFEKQRIENVADYNKIIEKGLSLGLKREQIEQALNMFHSNRLALINELNEEFKEQEAIAQRIKDIDAFGSGSQQRIQSYTESMNGLRAALAAGNITYEQAVLKSEEFARILNDLEVPEIFTGSNQEALNQMILGMEVNISQMQIMKNVTEDLKSSLLELGSSTVLKGFQTLGASFVSGSAAGKEFNQFLIQLIPQALSSASAMFLTAAATSFAMGPAGYAQGFKMLALSAATGVAAGAASASIAQAAGGGSSSTQGSGIYSSAVNTTTVNASDQFLETPTTRQGDLNVTVNNNTSSEITTREVPGPNNTRELEVSVNNVVRQSITDGAYNSAMQGQFGVTRKGVQVR